MFVVTPIHKQVINQDTGIDISVPNVRETEAPLGGVSVEYEIFVVTNLPAFKSQILKENDVVQFSVQKAYRDLEIFHEKISKKYRNAQLPSIPQGRLQMKISSEEKRRLLDEYMSHVAKDKDISHSDYFLQFIGIDKLKQQLKKESKFSSAASKIPNKIDSVETNDPSLRSIEVDFGTCNIGHKQQETNSNLFPEAKVCNKGNTFDEADLNIQPVEEEDNTQKKEYLFEEIKPFKDAENTDEQLFRSENKVQDVLFSEAKNDDLFHIDSPTPRNISSVDKISDTKKQANLSTEEVGLFEPPARFEAKKIVGDEDSLGDSHFKKKPISNIFLFQEQDLQLGGITKEDEDLFYVENVEGKKSNVNPFLSPSSDSTDEENIDESLDELTCSSLPSAVFSPENEGKVPVQKPVPTSPRQELPTKPKVAPRPQRKPTLPSKPVLPPKPKPTPKPCSKPSTAEINILVEKENLNVMDIMQYIEEEQKSSAENTSLFD